MASEAQKEADRLLAGLEHADEAVRLESLRGVARTPSAHALRLLRKSAKGDASPAVRAEAVRLLAEVADRLSGADLSGSGAGEGVSTRKELLYTDPDPGVRAQAVAALTMSFDARVPEILIGALDQEKDATVLETLIQAVASEGPAVAPKLVPYLSHDDARVRAAAVEVLGDTKDDQFLSHLVPLLEDRHERVRVNAVRALRSARQEAVLACVDEMLKRAPERDVRAALYVLRYFASAISVPRLTPRLTSNAPSVAAMARASLSSLAKKGSKRARRALERAGLNSTGVEVATLSQQRKIVQSPKEAAAAEERLAKVLRVVKDGAKDQLPSIRGRMDAEEDPRVLAAMVGAVGRLGGPGDVPLLASYLGHKRSRVRAAAVKAVHELDPRAVSMLLPSLRDRSSRVRAQGIVCLSRAKGINVMGSLKQMASSRDPRVVMTAVWAAAKIQTDGAKDVLESLATSADADVRAEALRALGRAALPATPPAAEPVSVAAVLPGPDESVLIPEPDDNTTVLIEGVPPAETELVEPGLRVDTHKIPKFAVASAKSRLPHAIDSGASLVLDKAQDETFIGEPISAEPSGVEDEHSQAKANALAAALAAAQAAVPSPTDKGVSQRLAPGNTARPSARVAKEAPRRPPVAALGGLTAAVAAVVFFMMAPPAPPPPPPPVVHSSPPKPTPAPSASVAPAPVEELRVTFGPAAAPPAALWNPPEQTLEEVEANIKLAHASRGITSKAIIHVMALDFMQAGYRASISRAREMSEAGRVDDAFRELDGTLAKLPPDHLAGRVAVLRALVTIAREGERFDRVKKYRTELLAEQQKLIEIATEAAKDGGLRDHELKNLLARIKEAEKQKAMATHSADWLSGDNMFNEQPDGG